MWWLVHTVASGSTSFDKNWTVCDNTAASLFFGRCYTQFDDNADGDRARGWQRNWGVHCHQRSGLGTRREGRTGGTLRPRP